MKNENGQVLVLFIIILPVLLLGGACLVDSSYMLYQKNRLDNINNDVLNSLKDQNDVSLEEVQRLIKLNDESIINDNLVVDKNITIENHLLVDSIFGKIIGIKNYRVASKKSVRRKDVERLVLDVDHLSDYDNTNNYLIQNNGVIYDNGLIFDEANLLIDDVTLDDNYRIEIAFSYDGDGQLLEFNNLVVKIINDKLFVNNKEIYSLTSDKLHTLKISNKTIYLNESSFANSIDIDKKSGSLLIGSDFKGIIKYIKIYSIGN